MRFSALLLLLLCQPAMAQQTTAEDIEQLQKDMYRYYSSKQTDLFLETTHKLKEACRQADNERLFYKAWGNEAIYIFSIGKREEGLKTANELYDYAAKHNSKFGLYTATYTLGALHNSLMAYDVSEQYFLKAIDYQRRYFPDESAAASYLGLAKTYFQMEKYESVFAYANKALAEPHIIPQHTLSAWSYICIADSKIHPEQFNEDYAKREKAKKLLGHDDNYGSTIESYRALSQGDMETALKLANNVTAPITRMELLVNIYEKWEHFEDAYFSLKHFQNFKDSINREELKRLIANSSSELNVMWAENENKDLRLANQQLLIEKVSRELEQRNLESEAAALKLQNREIELERASMKLKNDSLDKVSQTLMIKEYTTRMAASEQAAKARTILMILGTITTMLVIGFLLFTMSRNKKHIHKLEQINERLEMSQQAEHTAREAAEKALNVKRHFLNNISHEMRTPLNSICGFSDILTTPGFELSDMEKSDLKQRINESTALLTQVVDSMIELSYYDSLSSVEQEDVVQVNAFCREELSNFHPKLTEGLELKFMTDVSDDLEVKTNETCLRKTLHHLIDNSVKYTEKGQIVLHITDGSEPGMLTFTVSDTGPGIPIENHQAVFEPFVETGEQVKTTGMGLSVCRNMVALLGGTIAIDPGYKGGCSIVFSIAEHVVEMETVPKVTAHFAH